MFLCGCSPLATIYAYYVRIPCVLQPTSITLYREALSILRDTFENSVSEPYEEGGKRICDVSGFPANDRTIFLLAWGPVVAGEVLATTSESRVKGK